MYVREQKHICGETPQTAQYMEVDIYPISDRQHKASTRAKKREATSLAMQTYNDNRSKRYHVQLVNTNFTAKDYSFTATYDRDHHPAPGDTARADKDWSNFIKRVYRWCDKHLVRRPKWVAATEYSTIDEETGEVIGRHHHHAIIERTNGLSRDTLEDLWHDKRGSQIGLVRCERLRFEHGSVESLVRYITKNRRCARNWRQSQGLRKPLRPRPNDSAWSRKKLEEASTIYIDDAAYWEKKYPGYTLDRVDTTVSGDGMRHTTVIMWRAGVWHGTT